MLALLRPGAELPPDACDPAAFAELALAHRLHGVLRHALKRAPGPLPPWLEDARARLEAFAPAERARWVLQSTTAKKLAAAFQSAGVRAVFLKGFAYASDLYAAPDLRSFNDLDVLVADADLRKAADALAAAGFSRVAGPRPFGAMEETYRRSATKDATVDVDLHWDLVGRESLNRSMRLPPGEFLARSLERPGGMRVLTPEDALVFAAVNLVVHAYSPLQQFYDLALMANAAPDWPRVLERARACGVRAALGAGLAVAQACFGARVPEEVRADLAPPGWQRAAFEKLLRAGHLARPERYHEFGARVALKVLSQDGLGAVAGTLAYQPLRLLKRLAYRPASPR